MNAVPSPAVRARALWIIVSVVLVVALGAWATTCTGPRPHPTDETVPPAVTQGSAPTSFPNTTSSVPNPASP